VDWHQEVIQSAMWRGNPKLELATHSSQANGLPPNSALGAIKFRPVQSPQPKMCPVGHAKILDLYSFFKDMAIFKEGSSG